MNSGCIICSKLSYKAKCVAKLLLFRHIYKYFYVFLLLLILISHARMRTLILRVYVRECILKLYYATIKMLLLIIKHL